MVGSLSDFDPTVHTVPYEKLADIDKYMLGKLTETVKEVITIFDIFIVLHYDVFIHIRCHEFILNLLYYIILYYNILIMN